MKRPIFGLLAVLCVGLDPAMAQEPDDWEFEQDTARDLTVAAVRYEGGPGIVVQCRAGALTAALIGLPARTADLVLEASRADGRHDTQTWLSPGQDGVFLSDLVGRDVRFMRGGGAFSVRTADGRTPGFRTDFDLPAQSANLDRVLATCGWPSTDDRDQLPRIASDAVSFNRPGSREARETEEARERARGNIRQPGPGENSVSCIVRSMRLADCRSDHQLVPRRGGSYAARTLERTRIYADDPAAMEGGVVYLNLVTVVDYVTTTGS